MQLLVTMYISYPVMTILCVMVPLTLAIILYIVYTIQVFSHDLVSMLKERTDSYIVTFQA